MSDLLRQSDFSVVVFPFLKTSGPLTLGDLVFRSTDDVASLSPSQAAAVAEVAQMLYLQGNLRIKSASYAITPYLDFSRGTRPELTDLRSIHAVVRPRSPPRSCNRPTT